MVTSPVILRYAEGSCGHSKSRRSIGVPQDDGLQRLDQSGECYLSKIRVKGIGTIRRRPTSARLIASRSRLHHIDARRFIHWIAAILTLTAVYACWCRAPLIWDGAYQFNATLIMQRPVFLPDPLS